jgi:hypothetical protein
LLDADRCDNTVFADEPSYLICLCGTLANQLFPNTVRCLRILLLDSFHPDKPHPRPAHGFADGFGINAIILVALDVRFDELRGDEPYTIPALL